MIELGLNEVVHRVPDRAPSRVMTMVLEGEIGRGEWEDVADMLFRLAHRGVTQIVLDLSGVSHLDYRAVRPLMARAELFRSAGGDVVLAGLSPYVHAIFRSAGANDAFDYFPDAVSAARSFEPRAFAPARP